MSKVNWFATSPDRYREYRPVYPPALYHYLLDLVPAQSHAWDSGCGSGQAATALAEYFDKVTATDISSEQIAQAPQRENIEYRVCPAERFDTPSDSLDLIVAAQAVHWFDHEPYFARAVRCLKPGGVLAAWGYQLMHVDEEFDALIERLHQRTLGPYWPRGREFIGNGYAGIPFPFPARVCPDFHMETHWGLEQVLGYLNTWSAVKAYAKDKGENPVDALAGELARLWGEPARVREVRWPLILYTGLKPD